MNETVIKCEVCGINDAEVRDCRYNGNVYDEYLVCYICVWVNDEWFFKLKYAKEGRSKKRIMAQIVKVTWKDYLISRVI